MRPTSEHLWLRIGNSRTVCLGNIAVAICIHKHIVAYVSAILIGIISVCLCLRIQFINLFLTLENTSHLVTLHGSHRMTFHVEILVHHVECRTIELGYLILVG